MFSFIVRDRKFYKTLFSLALPIAAVNLISFAVTLGDSLMLGKLGETTMSAANLANQLWFMVMIMVFGSISGSLVFTSQYWGKGDIYSMKRIITIMLYLAAFISVTAGAMALLIPETVMSWYSKDPEVIRQGAQYLRIVGYCYPAYAITNAFVSALRSAHITKIAIVIYFISLVINLVGNYIFIFGHFGAPAMGIEGAALATCLARISEFVTLVIYLVFFEKKINYRLSDLFVSVRDYIKPFIKTGLIVVVNETLWGLGTTVTSMIIGHISTDFVAANSIANTAWQFVYVVINGLASATAVVIGNAVGHGDDKDEIQHKAQTIILMATAMGITFGLLLLAIRPLMLSWYDITEETKAIAFDLMASYALILILQAQDLHFIVGIFRGGGDTRFAAFIDLLFLWILSIPLGIYTGLILGMSPAIVYLFLRADELLKAVMGFFRMQSRKWIHDVTVLTDTGA